MANAKSFTSGTQTQLAMNKKKKKGSKLSEQKAASKAAQDALDDFRKKITQEAWFNARQGYFLVKKGDTILPDRGFLKGLEHPLMKIAPSKAAACKAIREIDAEIKYNSSVQYHGAYAGQRTGDRVKCGDSDWLVTSSPKLVEPIKGDCPNLKRLIETLIPNEIARHALYSWIQTQYKAIRRKEHSRCPVLILAGDANDGKTMLLQLFTTLRGGRQTNPIAAWSGEGPAWNDHLVGSECLNIDDSVAPKNYKARQKFATKIKEAIFIGAVTIDKRNHDSFTLNPQPVWGVAMAVNATSDAIKTIPALEGDDMNGKAVVIRTRRADILYREQGDSAASKRWKAYEDELPHFADWLLNDYKLPTDLPDGCHKSRSGALVYLDPEAMSELHRTGPAGLFEEVLLELRDGDYFAQQTRNPMTTTKLITEARHYCDRDRRIPESTQVAGMYLAQIAKRSDGCIECVGENRHHSKLWAFKELPDGNPS
jgi:hypothetical protein